MTKNELRILYREKREKMSHQDSVKLQDLLQIRFQQLSLPFISVLHRYLPAINKNEVDTEPIADLLRFRNPGMIEVVPRVNTGSNILQHYIFHENTILKLNQWGIPEPESEDEIMPEEIDMVLIPLLAFDESGHRVGYGKGFYDRFLSLCRPNCIKAGLSFPTVHQIAIPTLYS
jgi:5-formyltetrahydrofolate cyclo-ligase